MYRNTIKKLKKLNSVACSPQANYTDRADRNTISVLIYHRRKLLKTLYVFYLSYLSVLPHCKAEANGQRDNSRERNAVPCSAIVAD
jgi:hypothetical protein